MSLHLSDQNLIQVPLFSGQVPTLIDGEELDSTTEQDIFMFRLSVAANEQYPEFNQMDMDTKAKILLDIAKQMFPTLSMEVIVDSMSKPTLLNQFEG